MRASKITQNNNLVALTIDPIGKALEMARHVTQIVGDLRTKKSKIVASYGFGPLGAPICFKDAEEIFSYVEKEMFLPQNTSPISVLLRNSRI